MDDNNQNKTLRAIIIDVENGEVREATCEGDSLRFMQKAVGGLITQAVNLPNGDTIYVDDEGLLKEKAGFFTFKGAHQPFAGNGVIMGVDYEDGETIDAKSTLEEIRSKVFFMTPLGVRQGWGT